MRTFACCSLGLLLAVACNRTHLSPSFGKATRAALATQVIDPQAGAKPVPEQGLDPEEASIVSEGYRGSLAPAKKETARPPTILVTDPATAGDRPLAPPALPGS